MLKKYLQKVYKFLSKQKSFISKQIQNHERKKYEVSLIKLASKINLEPIIFADIGARGDLTYPWSFLERNNLLQVIGFEPDKEEFKRLSQKFPTRKYYPYAASDKEEDRILFLTKDIFRSSIHPPNIEYIKKNHLDNTWKVREIVGEEKISCKRIDNLLDDIDFLKIDTQGFEFEVIEGSSEILKKSCGLIAECWTSPIHKNQKQAFKVMEIMNDNNFQLFSHQYGNWESKYSNIFAKNAKIPVWIELLYFNDFNNNELDIKKYKKLIFLYACFGYFGKSYQLASKIKIDIKKDLKSFQPRINLPFFNIFIPKLH